MGFRIKELRETYHLTQEELAKRSGVSRATIAMMESQEAKNVQTQTLFKLAKALDVPIDCLFLCP